MADLHSHIIEFNLASKTARSGNITEIVKAKSDPGKIFWVHCDLNDEKLLQQIIHDLKAPSDLTDILNDNNPIPRLIESEEFIIIKIQALLDANHIKKQEINYSTIYILLTDQYCLTLCEGLSPAIEEFKTHYEKALRFAQTTCFILFMIFDNVLNDFSHQLFLFESRTDKLDDTQRLVHKNYYRIIMALKSEVLHAKRHLSTIRDILMRISGRKISVISEQCRKSLLDQYNHAQVLVSEADSIRESLNGILDQIDNSIIHSMNQSMQILTAFAAIFMPLTLISGIYGMNFDNIPELHWKYGYYFALLLMVVTGFALFYYFKRKHWF